MKALGEIGFKKSLKFFFTTIALIIFKLMIFPQLRRWYLKLVGVKVGKNAIIHNVKFFNGYRKGFSGLVIGNDCFIGDETMIDLADSVVLEDQVTLAERVLILSHTNVGFNDHPLQSYFPSSARGIRIKRGAFIGSNVTILPGVTIGECAFVAAGSLVREDVPSWTLVAGVPAKVVRKIGGKG
jgi:acetyltransferase-like isoleucine patch superfamily enzyme